jgi:hypothetical protein
VLVRKSHPVIIIPVSKETLLNTVKFVIVGIFDDVWVEIFCGTADIDGAWIAISLPEFSTLGLTATVNWNPKQSSGLSQVQPHEAPLGPFLPPTLAFEPPTAPSKT